MYAFIASVNITCWVFVAAQKIWPYGIFLDEGCFSQALGCVSVALTQHLLTSVLQIICNEEHTSLLSVTSCEIVTKHQCFLCLLPINKVEFNAVTCYVHFAS